MGTGLETVQRILASAPGKSPVITSKVRIIGLGLALGVVSWVFDAFVDSAFFSQASFIDLLILAVPPHEIYVRTAVMTLFVIFGAVVASQQERIAKSTETATEFGSAISASGHAIYITDVDGTIRFVNPAFEEITGYSAADAIGRTPRILKSGEMNETYYSNLWETVTSGETWDEVIINKRRTGELYYAHQTITPVTVNGEIDSYVAIQTDITESEDLKLRLDTIIDNLAGIVYRCRNERGWPMEYVGGDVSGLAGYPAEALESGEVSWGSDVIHPDDQEDVWENVKTALSEDGQFKLTYRIVTTEGETKWVWEYGRVTNPQADNGELLDGFIVDVTREKELEAELEHTVQQLQVLDRVLRHNLHNEMTVLMGRAELIANETDGENRRHAELILHKLERLLDMVDKERNISKTLAETPPLKPVEIDPLLTAIISRFREEYPAARITYTNRHVDSVLAHNSIHLALNELIENAIEHSETDNPEVEVVVTSRESGVRIDVIDTCPPLPEMERKIIFEDDDITPLKHGSGLGLWLVTIVVYSASGTFSHEYREPCGNVFSIRLEAVTENSRRTSRPSGRE